MKTVNAEPDDGLHNPIVIDPPGFNEAAAWQECRDYVDQCGGLAHEDGEPNWRAAFGADPGICSCPACHRDHWAWGRKQRCTRCGFEYETDAWLMYSYGVQAAKRTDWRSALHERRLAHPYYRYGFEHPESAGADAYKAFKSIDWRSIFGTLEQ